MSKSDHIADTVSKYLAADKEIRGRDDWASVDDRNIKYRRKWPVFVSGESQGDLVAIYYTSVSPPKFTISLLLGERIYALDYDENHRRVNAANRPVDCPAIVVGPHVHAWDDNKHLATKTKIPIRLTIARELDSEFRSFDSAFRWFCAEINITLPHDIDLDPPKKETLI